MIKIINETYRVAILSYPNFGKGLVSTYSKWYNTFEEAKAEKEKREKEITKNIWDTYNIETCQKEIFRIGE